METVSEYITYGEAVKSQIAIRDGIDNTPGQEELSNMQYVASQIFDPIREWVGGPLGVSSFYRCPQLNKAAKGSKSSDHMKGFAIDIDADMFNTKRDGQKVTNKMIFDHIIECGYDFDQLIWEYGTDEDPAWVHVSMRKGHNRGQVKRARINSKGRTYYEEIS